MNRVNCSIRRAISYSLVLLLLILLLCLLWKWEISGIHDELATRFEGPPPEGHAYWYWNAWKEKAPEYAIEFGVVLVPILFVVRSLWRECHQLWIMRAQKHQSQH